MAHIQHDFRSVWHKLNSKISFQEYGDTNNSLNPIINLYIQAIKLHPFDYLVFLKANCFFWLSTSILCLLLMNVNAQNLSEKSEYEKKNQ